MIDRVFFIHLFYFVAGMWVGTRVEQVRAWLGSISPWPLALIALAAAGISVWIWVLGADSPGVADLVEWEQRSHWLYSVPIVAVSSGLLVWRWSMGLAGRAHGICRRLVVEAGRCSYGLYLLHLVYYVLLRDHLMSRGVGLSHWAYVPVAVGGTALASYLTLRWAEQAAWLRPWIGVSPASAP